MTLWSVTQISLTIISSSLSLYWDYKANAYLQQVSPSQSPITSCRVRVMIQEWLCQCITFFYSQCITSCQSQCILLHFIKHLQQQPGNEPTSSPVQGFHCINNTAHTVNHNLHVEKKQPLNNTVQVIVGHEKSVSKYAILHLNIKTYDTADNSL